MCHKYIYFFFLSLIISYFEIFDVFYARGELYFLNTNDVFLLRRYWYVIKQPGYINNINTDR